MFTYLTFNMLFITNQLNRFKKSTTRANSRSSANRYSKISENVWGAGLLQGVCVLDTTRWAAHPLAPPR
jgi:hypothetical protein